MKRFDKKSVAAIGVTGLALLAVVAWQFAMPSRAEAPHLERYLPANTIAFVQVHDLRAQALNVADSEAWHEFAKTNPSASSLFLIGANHAGILDASYALALTGVTIRDGQPHANVALIAEFGSSDARATFERRVLKLSFEERRSGAKGKTELYDGIPIESAGTGGHASVFYARRQETMFVSDNAETIKSLLDTGASKTASLESNAQLQLARSRIAFNDGMFGFLDGAALTRLVDSLPPDNRGEVEAFRQFFHNAGADAVEAVAMTSSFAEGRVVERFTAVAPAGGHGLLRTALSTAPSSQSLLLLVPSDALRVFDASISNASLSFDEFLDLTRQIAAQKGKPGPDDALQKILTETGVDVRNDIVASLGSEIALAQIPVASETSGVILLNLTDQQRFEAAIRTAAQHKGYAIAARDYRGQTINTVSGRNDHSGSYAFVRGNFIASKDGAAVERIIDAAQSAPSLLASAQYQTAANALTGNPVFVYYESNSDFTNRLGRMLSGRGTTFQPADQPSHVKPSFAYGLAKSDGFYVESYSPLGTFPTLLTAVTARLALERQNKNSD